MDSAGYQTERIAVGSSTFFKLKIENMISHNMPNGMRLIDPIFLAQLKSQIPARALVLLNELMSNHEIKFLNYQDNPMKAATAFTFSMDGKYYVWLNPDETEIIDSFVHEIGQIHMHVLGYRREAKPRLVKQEISRELAGMTVNAFRGAITEHDLEKYGIDRGNYRLRRYEGFKKFLNEPLKKELIERNDMTRLHHRTQSIYQYLLNRLLLGDGFGDLESLWNQTISSSTVKDDAAHIFAVASKKELTPSRYVEVQKYFIKTLKLEKYVTI